jgi:hypothetical protein
VLTPVRPPRATAVAERVIGTLRRERLDHVIPLNEAHLRTSVAAPASRPAFRLWLVGRTRVTPAGALDVIGVPAPQPM